MPSDAAGRSRRPSPRDRLLKAADELFYAEGLHSVGIDRVIARADVARASLYSTFGSKDESDPRLPGTADGDLEGEAAGRRRGAHRSARAPAECLRRAGRGLRPPRLSGLPFQPGHGRGPAGSAAYEVPRAYRAWLRDLLRELAAAAGAPDPDLLASQIHLLYDGAMLAASLDGNAAITTASRAAGEALLDAALASRGSGRHRKEPVGVG